MMGFFAQYGLFLLKTLTFIIIILIVMGGIFAIGRGAKSKYRLEITSLNKNHDELQRRMLLETKDQKSKKKKQKKNNKPSLYLVDFIGDIKASQVNELREIITAILAVAKAKDEIVIHIESPGGTVNSYGLAAAQLQRIRDKQIYLTACIDKIAASGGYLMACVANQIVAAPFAIIGSIGVVAQVPNFHRLLKKHDVDVELLTAGEYKRTLTLFGENTEKGRKKFQEDLEKIHQAFSNYVLEHREGLDMKQIATGEHWLAKDAYELKLVDSLQTSDEYLIEKMANFNVFKVAIPSKKSVISRLLQPVMQWLHPWG